MYRRGVSDLEVDDGVDLHGDVILGNDGLGREIHHLLLQGYVLGYPLNEGNLEVEAHAPHGLECAQPLNDEGPGLLDHADVGGQHGQHKDNHNDGDNKGNNTV